MFLREFGMGMFVKKIKGLLRKDTLWTICVCVWGGGGGGGRDGEGAKKTGGGEGG